MLNQKKSFLAGEGDKWFERNKENLQSKNFQDECLYKEIVSAIVPKNNELLSLLEIGCGNGKRLQELNSRGFLVTGLDPSEQAVTNAKANGINAVVGTADELPFAKDQFDVVTFGFCLYLCDRDDLFKIASEADRVLKRGGFLFILDFYAKKQVSVDYKHLTGIKSYKMDYKSLFEWHPDYTVIKHTVGSHDDFSYTENENEWVAVSVIKKR